VALNNPAFNTPAFQDPRAVSTYPGGSQAGRLGGQTQYAPPPAAEAATLEGAYTAPSAGARETDRMTVEDTVYKTFGLFGILLVTAVVGWVWTLGGMTAVPGQPTNVLPWIIGALGGFVLAMVNIFKKKPSVPLIIAYAAFEGLFIGGISAFYATLWQGIIPVAVFGTLGVVGVTLALFASGKVRASSRATKVFLVLMVGYLVFSLVNVVLMLTGVVSGFGGLRDVTIFGIPLGIPLGILVVLMAAYSLVIDFDQVKRGVETGQPRVYGWTAAFGIMVTVVWLYLEILRLASYFMPRN
jgi:uncharacterized YccA/Bax inhibitor family protein